MVALPDGRDPEDTQGSTIWSDNASAACVSALIRRNKLRQSLANLTHDVSSQRDVLHSQPIITLTR